MVDIGRALKVANSTGKVVFGERETEKAVRLGEAQLVIMASNCENDFLTSGEHGVKIHRYKGNNMELGALCGKPFSVSSLVIVDKGSSNILSLG
jgi:large subunit ribosomal protein L30e